MYHMSHSGLLSNDSLDQWKEPKKERPSKDWAPQMCLGAGNSKAKAESMRRDVRAIPSWELRQLPQGMAFANSWV